MSFGHDAGAFQWPAVVSYLHSIVSKGLRKYGNRQAVGGILDSIGRGFVPASNKGGFCIIFGAQCGRQDCIRLPDRSSKIEAEPLQLQILPGYFANGSYDIGQSVCSLRLHFLEDGRHCGWPLLGSRCQEINSKLPVLISKVSATLAHH